MEGFVGTEPRKMRTMQLWLSWRRYAVGIVSVHDDKSAMASRSTATSSSASAPSVWASESPIGAQLSLPPDHAAAALLPTSRHDSSAAWRARARATQPGGIPTSSPGSTACKRQISRDLPAAPTMHRRALTWSTWPTDVRYSAHMTTTWLRRACVNWRRDSSGRSVQ